LAVPRGPRESSHSNGLGEGLGENRPIDIQDVSKCVPKPSASEIDEKPYLIVDGGDLPATARELRDLLASSGHFFDRGVPIKVIHPAGEMKPMALPLTANRLVVEAHDLCRPRRSTASSIQSLPNRVARMYLDMIG
jgi:hypothetical protein